MSKQFIVDDYNGPITAVMNIMAEGIKDNNEAQDELELNIQNRFMALPPKDGKKIVMEMVTGVKPPILDEINKDEIRKISSKFKIDKKSINVRARVNIVSQSHTI